jgi:hypothetical protein
MQHIKHQIQIILLHAAKPVHRAWTCLAAQMPLLLLQMLLCHSLARIRAGASTGYTNEIAARSVNVSA